MGAPPDIEADMLAHEAARPPSDAHAIPRIAHFVFGLSPQTSPFHLVHYLAIESCRRVVQPARMYLHCKHLPYGVYWDLVRPHLDLVRVDEVPEVLAADYSEGLVPDRFRYAHHADFIRLDVLLRHGGIYADLDVLFLRPLPDSLFDESFVIGAEDPTRDERTGRLHPSLCNAVLLSRPRSPFAQAWRDRMGDALDGAWSNHSCRLARRVADELPDQVTVLPKAAFYPAACTPEGVRSLLEEDELDVGDAYAVHLWAHTWWTRDRRHFTNVHADRLTADHIRSVDTSFNRLARPFLPDLDLW